MACWSWRPKSRELPLVYIDINIFNVLLTLRPSDCKQMTTELRFCRSQRSTLWKVSCVGTPKFLAHSRKAEMFSMHLNAILLSLTFLMLPGCRELASLQRITPSLSTSKKLSVSPDVLMGSPVTALIHSSDSCASSSLYLELICKERKGVDNIL